MALEAAHDFLHAAGVQCTPAQAAAALLGVVVLLLVLRLTTTTATQKRKNQQNHRHHKLPPSPPGKLPIIGHLHLIGSHPHVAFRDLHARHGDGGLMLVQVGAVPTVVVSTPQAAEAVLRTHDHVLASRPRNPVADIIRYGSTDVAFAPYGDYWRTARKVVNTHLLSAKMVLSKRRDREEEVRLVIARIRQAAETAETSPAAMDMTEVLGGYASDFVCRAVLGESHRKQGRNKLFRELTETSAALLGGFNVEDYFPRLADVDLFLRVICAKAKGVSKRWDRLFNDLLSEYALSAAAGAGTGNGNDDGHHSEDFVHLLLSLQKDYGLTTDNIKGILVNMFEAAIETSFLVLEYSMSELMNNRHVLAKLKSEVRAAAAATAEEAGMVMEEDLSRMPYLKATIKEAMRIHPPAPFLLPHFSTHDCEINGYTIPAGTRVIVNAWALARDPACWEKAEEFFPERFMAEQGGRDAEVDMYGKDIRFVPFGAGRRICAGATFAIATVEIMLANLIYHFDWEMPPEMERAGAKVDMSDQFGMTLRRTNKLFLVPKIPK